MPDQMIESKKNNIVNSILLVSMKKYRYLLLVIFFSVFVFKANTQSLRLNQTQVIGSHNSYKSGIDPEIIDFLKGLNPQSALSLQYEHLPLRSQLDMGLRNLELDVFHDPKGGRYSNPKGLDIIKQKRPDLPEFDPESKLDEPGMKLFHVQDIDFRTHHFLFKDALEEIKSWSNANKDHHPVFILINAKDGLVPGTTTPLPFTAEALDSIDMEIRNTLGADKLITPALVQGKYESLEESILNGGWPELDQMKGKFLFVLDENEEKTSRYLSLHPSLERAVFFVNVKEGNPNAGFMVINDAITHHDTIKKLVQKGYIIRTRADSDTKEARLMDYGRFTKAQSSGAQVISTDYYIPSKLFESTYRISYENGKFERKNPFW